jgi:hypothetical protein
LSNDWREVRVHREHEGLQRLSLMKAVRIGFDAVGIVDRSTD